MRLYIAGPMTGDARLIVAAVNALPDLFDQLDSMEAELADYRAEDRRKRESAEMRRRGAGKDLACWCPLDAPCHADVLLELANEDGAP